MQPTSASDACHPTVIRAEIYPIAKVPAGKLAITPRPRVADWLAAILIMTA